MKLFLPCGVVSIANIYEPHLFSGTETYQVIVDRKYMEGFEEFDDHFKLTPHLKGKTMTKISSRKRPPVLTNNPDMVLRAFDLLRVRNRPQDQLFRENDFIINMEIVPLPKNPAGYTGTVLVLNNVEINF